MHKVEKDHEWLQITQAELEAETEEILQVSHRVNDNVVRALKLMGRQLFFIWAVVIVLFIASFLLMREFWFSPLAPGGKPLVAANPASGSSAAAVRRGPGAASPGLPAEWDEVQGLLRQVQEAQLDKDINRLMRAYSPRFPDLDGKKARILQTWERYDYLDLRFTVENVAQPEGNSLKAKVVWDATLEDRRSRAKTYLVKKYTVSLVQESGKWLIQSLSEEQTPTLLGTQESNSTGARAWLLKRT